MVEFTIIPRQNCYGALIKSEAGLIDIAKTLNNPDALQGYKLVCLTHPRHGGGDYRKYIFAKENRNWTIFNKSNSLVTDYFKKAKRSETLEPTEAGTVLLNMFSMFEKEYFHTSRKKYAGLPKQERESRDITVKENIKNGIYKGRIVLLKTGYV